MAAHLTVPAVDPAALAGLLRDKSAELAGVTAGFAELAATDNGRPVGIFPAAPAPAELPRWHTPHHCGDFAEHVHTWSEVTRFGRAVWLVAECRVCGRAWDVLSDTSDEGVITASVFPVWAVTACELCCRVECAGAACRCPCHTDSSGVAQ